MSSQFIFTVSVDVNRPFAALHVKLMFLLNMLPVHCLGYRGLWQDGWGSRTADKRENQFSAGEDGRSGRAAELQTGDRNPGERCRVFAKMLIERISMVKWLFSSSKTVHVRFAMLALNVCPLMFSSQHWKRRIPSTKKIWKHPKINFAQKVRRSRVYARKCECMEVFLQANMWATWVSLTFCFYSVRS